MTKAVSACARRITLTERSASPSKNQTLDWPSRPGKTTPKPSTTSMDHDNRSRTSRTSVCTVLAIMVGSMTTP